MDKILKLLGGRKVVMTVIVFIITTVLLLISKLNEADFAQIIKTLLIIYPAANVGQRLLVDKTKDITDGIDNFVEEYPIGKKFIINLAVYILVALLTGFQVLSSETYLSITTWIIGLYSVSNVTSKIKLKS